MIDRVAAALAPAVSELVVVSNAPDAAGWLPGVRVIRDELAGGGSAAGVHAAAAASPRGAVVVGWDLPFVTTALVELLVERARAAPADAVVPAGARAGELEPLCAWYAPRAAVAIAAAWPSGERSLHALLRRVSAHVVSRAEVAAVGDPTRLFANVNTAGDLADARRLAGGDAAPATA